MLHKFPPYSDIIRAWEFESSSLLFTLILFFHAYPLSGLRMQNSARVYHVVEGV